MAQDQQKRLIELYEKGILTKEEARACFLELEESPDFLFVEEKTKMTFTLPSLKVFSSSKLKQDYVFSDVESLFMSLSEGRVSFMKGKTDQVQLRLVYPQQVEETLLPQIYVENKGLHFASPLPCQLTVILPDQWMAVLELEVGRADVKLDYLPFEDISLRSTTDKKQQDIRIASLGQFPQHLTIQLSQAPIHLQVPKEQGVKGRIEGAEGSVSVNRKKKSSPYLCEKDGDNLLYLQIRTDKSPCTVKGVKDVTRIL